MSDVQPTIDDEIDLLELVAILWSEKVIIGCFLAVALVVGGLWIATNKKTYETVTEFEIAMIPPSESDEEIVADLRKEFHSRYIFSQWLETMPNAKLQLEDVVPTVLINEVVFLSDIDEEALVLIQDDKILIRTNETGLVLDAIDYAKFVADLLSEKYVLRAQEEYDRVLALSDRLFERRDRGSLPATFNGLPALERLTALDSYLSRVGDGCKFIFISLPSKPVATNISIKVLLAVTVMIGGVAGVLFALVRHAYRKRKFMKARLVS